MALQGPQVIIGLGNPGAEYRDTRHNAGFDVVDVLAETLRVSYWKVVSNALVGETSLRGEKILLIKPQSFMNLSGGPIKGLAGIYGFDSHDILVIHDELDLMAGTLRLKYGGGHAGHRGLRSTSLSMGQDYARLRVGIGRPPGRMPAHAFVLQKMRGAELEEYRAVISRAAQVAVKTIEDGLRAAMNVYNVSEKEDRQTGEKEGSQEGTQEGSAERLQEGSGEDQQDLRVITREDLRKLRKSKREGSQERSNE